MLQESTEIVEMVRNLGDLSRKLYRDIEKYRVGVERMPATLMGLKTTLGRWRARQDAILREIEKAEVKFFK